MYTVLHLRLPFEQEQVIACHTQVRWGAHTYHTGIPFDNNLHCSGFHAGFFSRGECLYAGKLISCSHRAAGGGKFPLSQGSVWNPAVAQPHTNFVLAKHDMVDFGMEKKKSEARFISLKLIQSLIQGPSYSVNLATYWLSRGWVMQWLGKPQLFK